MIWLSYTIYISITAFICIYVGWQFYKHGKHYLYDLIPKRETADRINSLLLIGYYLLNLGYLLASMSMGSRPDDQQELIEILSNRIGTIIFTLGVVHFFNLWWLRRLRAFINL